ncbi:MULTISPECIES: hypothetical protein [Rhodopseudomonas]|uniref:hypothetical protein n=1 Tax=Rhodopseudomonas TaxID=1073 RepID=UPI00128E8ACD|nr:MULTISPECIES: hypothetical protein [Rhodopseudomonas]MDF3811289.1 hypothetical protein [Rhodopseudomonas sp. BAL398]WOK18614.1 hypothetical protein RBJ75_03545 [Rhodopseudomonas sp. BAL398]
MKIRVTHPLSPHHVTKKARYFESWVRDIRPCYQALLPGYRAVNWYSYLSPIESRHRNTLAGFESRGRIIAQHGRLDHRAGDEGVALPIGVTQGRLILIASDMIAPELPAHRRAAHIFADKSRRRPPHVMNVGKSAICRLRLGTGSGISGRAGDVAEWLKAAVC